MGVEIPGTLEALELRVRTLLPEQYQDSYEEVQPVSMGSAELKYGRDGRVAWDSIWGSFCDLAMAGGPPHKGTLLEPGSQDEIEASQERYTKVAEEICRGIRMATGLKARPSSVAGWVCVECGDATAADWLVRAITMENVSAFREGSRLYLPAGPAFRIAKEVKNVITAVAKTAHYWFDHTWPAQQREIDELLTGMGAAAPLLTQALAEGFSPEARQALCEKIRERVERETDLRLASRSYPGWCGFDCPDVQTAIWMMRALVASNVLARREELTLFAPIHPENDPEGDRVTALLIQVRGFAAKRATEAQL